MRGGNRRSWRRAACASAFALLLAGCGGSSSGEGQEPSVCGGPVRSAPTLCALRVEPDRVPARGSIVISFGVSDLEGDISRLCLGLGPAGGPPVVVCEAVAPGGAMVNEFVSTDPIPLVDEGSGETLLEPGSYELTLGVADAAGHESNLVTAHFTVVPEP